MMVSGGGRTVLNIHKEIQAGRLDARIAIVIASRRDCKAIERCRAVGLHVEVVSRRDTPDDVFHNRIAELLADAGVELVCLAGFLCFWHINQDFAGRVVNIHPALLPKYGGKGFFGNRVHAAVLEAGETTSGCTVHFADNLYDHGPTILQREVEISPGDTTETLAAKVYEQETLAYPQAIQMFINGELELPYPDLAGEVK